MWKAETKSVDFGYDKRHSLAQRRLNVLPPNQTRSFSRYWNLYLIQERVSLSQHPFSLSLSLFNGSVVKREMDDNVGLLNSTCNIYCCFISNLEKQLKHKEAKLFMIVFSSVGYHYNFRYRCLSYRGEFGKLKSAG